MQDQWTDRLSEYIDDELGADDRRAIESHLLTCPDCAATLADLQRVVERARSIGPRPPATNLWPGIAERIGGDERVAPFRARPAGAARPISFTLPQLAAAAIVLVALSSAVAWRVGSRSGDRPAEASRHADPAAALARSEPQTDRESSGEHGTLAPVGFADEQYDAAVADLERALAKGRGRLDKATIAIVEENLRIIDQAIAQARDALAADPANAYLSNHLVETRRKKLDLLRRAAALTSETD